jgi:peptidyl-prolyl cis-trans isomerase SurA
MFARPYRRLSIVGPLLAALPVVLPATARAAVVERIVAVVGDKPILLSDLRGRAQPYLQQIHTRARNAAEATAEENKMFQELLKKMVDERLEEGAAERARVTVTAEDVDQGLANIAGQAKLSVREVVEEAKRQGLSEQQYREEVRRQLLDGKLIQLRVKGRVRPTEEDARAVYARVVRELGAEPPVDVRMLALRLPPAASSEQTVAREALASELAQRARNGEDFCALVTKYSDDAETVSTCGSRGMQPTGNVIPEVMAVIKPLQPGQVANPVRFGDQAIVVIQLAARQRVPAFEDVRDAMLNRAFTEALDRQRATWLSELRKQVYVDVRY